MVSLFLGDSPVALVLQCPVAVKYSDERPFAGTVHDTNSQHAEERLIGLVLVPPQQRVSCDVEVRKSWST